MGVLLQDVRFEVDALRGQRMERIGYLRIGPEPAGHILFVRPVGGSWQRGYLDYFFATWDDWGEVGAVPDAVDDADDITFVDCTDKFANPVVRRAFAHAEHDRMPRLEVEFEDGARLELRVIDETDWESQSLVVIHAS